MFGFRITTEEKINKLIDKSEIKLRKRFFEEMQAKNTVLKHSMSNEAQLRTGIREIIDTFNMRPPAITMKNEELISELKEIYSTLIMSQFETFSLLVEMAEKKDIATITKIEEFVNAKTETNGIN